LLIFQCRYEGGAPRPDLDETTEAQWFDRKALPEMPPPEMRAVQLAKTGANPVFDRR
jgi:NADH pyrophosphatase NudC (nudix superfamily)